MKKLLLFLTAFCFAFGLNAQNLPETVQGIPYDHSKVQVGKSDGVKSTASLRSTRSGEESGDPDFKFEDIKFWVGKGANKAAMVVEWHDGKGIDALVWGYKWDGDAYGIDMVSAIAKADPRFLFLTHATGPMGNTIAGLGYDLDGEGAHCLYFEGDTSKPYLPVNGTVTTTEYDYDDWSNGDPNDHWYSGWYTGYWSYFVKDAQNENWSYSGLGATSRKLVDGAWDGWSVSDLSGMSGNGLGNKFIAAPKQTNYSDGVFIVNEDWFGHNNSTVNFLGNDGTWSYRVFQTENPGHELGCTSQFGAMYDGKLFIVSKQSQDPGASVAGSRLAIANARTLKVIKEFPNVGAGDGRAFLGVDTKKAYISTSNGITKLNLETLELEGAIVGTGNPSGGLYAGQVGTMLRVGDRVFAVNQSKGIHVIDVNKDEITETIEAPMVGGTKCGFGSIVLSKDGNLWVSVAPNTSGSGSSHDFMLKLDPWTLETEKVELGSGEGIPNSWYAWTADGFCASTQENKIYWKNNAGWFNATKIYYYDIDAKTTSQVFDFSTIDGGVWGLYGAGFRIDPITDEIVASLFQSFGQRDYTVARVDLKTQETKTYPMEENYWFPAMPVFPDVYSPSIDKSFKKISIANDTIISLADKIEDKDDMFSSIIKTITIANDALADVSIFRDSIHITPKPGASGETTLTLTANSRGKLASQEIKFVIVIAPVLVTDLEDAEGIVGESASFKIEVTGLDLNYQWYKNGEVVTYANKNEYKVSSLKLADTGTKVKCIVSNAAGEVISREATLTTKLAVPTVTRQPQSLTKKVGQSANISVSGKGGDLSYQWYKDGEKLEGETSNQIRFAYGKLTRLHAGDYTCELSNTAGKVMSDVATLTVNGDAQTITFEEIGTKKLEDKTVQLVATASSDLPVTFTSEDEDIATVDTNGLVTMKSSGTVTIVAYQEGDGTFVPAEPVRHVLTITSNNAELEGITINGEAWNIENCYTLDCGQTDFTIEFNVEANATVWYNGQKLEDKQGSYTMTMVDVKSFTFEVKSQDETASKNYEIKVEKFFSFEDIVVVKWNNTLLVNNNSDSNGGYKFNAYKWFKDGVEIGSKQFYSAGSKENDKLDASANYSVELTTTEGKVLHTCEANVALRIMRVDVYPIPVNANDNITIDADLDEEQLSNATIELFNMQGNRVSQTRAAGSVSSVRAPGVSGTYILVFKGKGVVREFKVLVK